MEVVERRKLVTLCLGVLLLHSHAASSPQTAVVARSDAVSLAQPAAPTEGCAGEWDEPFFRLWEFAQSKCEATRCSGSDAGLVSAVLVTWDNYDGTAAREKPVELLLWADEGGLPGRVLWSLETTTTLLDSGEVRRVRYDVVPPVQADPVWFGHRELQPGPPTSLFDFLPSSTHASSKPPCEDWELQDYGDYLQQIERAHLEVSASATSGAPDCG